MKLSPRNKSKSYGETGDPALHGNTGSNRLKNVPAPTRLWPALLALNGFGFAVNQACALELGDITVHSTLGQPLRASIVYALAQNEMVESHCIRLRPPAASSGLPVVRNATARAANGTIQLAGKVPIREPVLSLRLTVDCPGTAQLSRDYVAFVDPFHVGRPEAAAATRVPAAARRQDPEAAAPARHRARPAAAEAAPIGGRSTYRVQPGDTLSGIASRIEDRGISLWDAVEVIFAANPGAFVDNDRNRLKAGSLLALPEMGPVADAGPARPAAPHTPTTGRNPASWAGGATAGAAPAEIVRDPAIAPATTGSPQAMTPARRPGGLSTAADSPFVSPVDAGGEPGDRGATGNDGAGGRRFTPRVSVAPGDAGDGLGSLAWLGGTGIAIILALLLFGRQLRDRFGSPGDLLPAGVTRGRRRRDVAGASAPTTTLGDDHPAGPDGRRRARPAALDASFGTGSGFEDDGEIDVAQDFGFSTSRDLYGDVDPALPAEAARESGPAPTDVVPPRRFDDRRLRDTVIVEREVPPSDDTGEYDLSMIVDATRQPIEEITDTTKDLHAVQVDTGDDDVLDSDNLTLSREVDYKILEQDYEEELTATQALNAKFARETEMAMQAEDLEATARFESSEAPTAEYAAVDEALTRELPGGDDSTVEMPLNQDRAAEAPDALEDGGANAELTTKLPSADNDETVECDIESATVDTKKLRAS